MNLTATENDRDAQHVEWCRLKRAEIDMYVANHIVPYESYIKCLELMRSDVPYVTIANYSEALAVRHAMRRELRKYCTSHRVHVEGVCECCGVLTFPGGVYCETDSDSDDSDDSDIPSNWDRGMEGVGRR